MKNFLVGEFSVQMMEANKFSRNETDKMKENTIKIAK